MDGRVECGRPILHGGVVMRMGDRDGGKAAEASDERLGRLIEQGDAIPQHIALRRTKQKRALVDGEGRHGLQAVETWLMQMPGIAMRRRKVLARQPRLARRGDILALILADRAASGRFGRSG